MKKIREAFLTNELSPSECLFGRDRLVSQLKICAGRNVSITGIRRVGKTSVVKRVIHIIRKDDNIRAYPIYMDVKEDNIKGQEAFYQYMFACLFSQLCMDGVLKKHWTCRGLEITCDDDIWSIMDQIEHLSFQKSSSLFGSLVTESFRLVNKTILFVFDEYEYIFKEVLSTPAGFMKIRNLSTRPVENGLPIFAFWVVGTRTWDEFCGSIGSGECNSIVNYEHVAPLEAEDFASMWNFECSLVGDGRESLEREYLNRSYYYSGGVPFYGKLIGAHILREGEFPTVSKFKGLLSELLNSLGPDRRKILESLVVEDSLTAYPNCINELITLGLVRENGKGTYVIPIGVLHEYLSGEKLGDNQQHIVPKLVDDITELIQKINELSVSGNSGKIFDIVNSFPEVIKTLRKVCDCGDAYTHFSLAMYRIIYEWTKIGDEARYTLAKLSPSIRNHEFVKIVDTNRHIYGKAHEEEKFNPAPRAITKEEMQILLLGKVVILPKKEDYMAMQIATLKRFVEYLCDIQENLSVSIGAELSGTIVWDKDKSHRIVKFGKKEYWLDKTNGFAKGFCPENYTYSENEIVTFKLKPVSHKANPSLTIFYAIDIQPQNPLISDAVESI